VTDTSGHERRDVPPAEAGRRGNAQVTARLDAAGGHARLRVLHVVDHALAVLEERRALERQRELARGTHQQLDAEPLLERVEAAADDRRRDAFRVRGRRQAALCRDRGKRFDLLEPVHDSQRRRCRPSNSLNRSRLGI
jgi:hypothetical protein